METSVIQRVVEILKSKNLSSKAFSEIIGFNYSTLNNYITGRRSSVDIELIRRISSSFDDINLDWIITGKGDMIKQNIYTPNKSNTSSNGSPYYNVDFIGGFEIMINDQTINPDYYIDFEPYNKPGVVWCNITGHSMEPAITHGDIIAMQEVKSWREFILLDEVYGLVTEEFRTVKRVSKSDKDGYYTLIPVNGNYKPQEIPKSIIQRVYKVLGSVKRF